VLLAFVRSPKITF